MMIVWYVYGTVDHALGADNSKARRIALRLYGGDTSAAIPLWLMLHVFGPLVVPMPTVSGAPLFDSTCGVMLNEPSGLLTRLNVMFFSCSADAPAYTVYCK